jgi:predicted nucleic acid-binding protein
MNVVDSSAWIAYLTGGPNAAFFAKPIESTEKLIVPVLVLYEVFKRIQRARDESSALEVVAHMMQGKVVDLTATLAIDAARLSVEKKLPMADAMILASAQAHDAVLWTQDAHFEGIEKVEYRAAKPR